MKTERLVDWLNSVPTWYVSDGKILDEVIKRLEEFEELKRTIRKYRDFEDYKTLFKVKME